MEEVASLVTFDTLLAWHRKKETIYAYCDDRDS